MDSCELIEKTYLLFFVCYFFASTTMIAFISWHIATSAKRYAQNGNTDHQPVAPGPKNASFMPNLISKSKIDKDARVMKRN